MRTRGKGFLRSIFNGPQWTYASAESGLRSGLTRASSLESSSDDDEGSRCRTAFAPINSAIAASTTNAAASSASTECTTGAFIAEQSQSGLSIFR